VSSVCDVPWYTVSPVTNTLIIIWAFQSFEMRIYVSQNWRLCRRPQLGLAFCAKLSQKPAQFNNTELVNTFA
jgi:hypothetical protein